MNTENPPNLPSTPQPQTDKLATTSMALGIIGLIPCMALLLAIPTFICGIISLNRISESKGALTGKNRAIIGLVTGGIGVVMIPIIAILAAMLLPALQMARASGQSVQCADNLKQISESCMAYAASHQDQLPPNLQALQQAGLISNPQQLICPALAHDKSATPPSYLYFGSGLKLSKLDGRTILISDGNKRHGLYFPVCFGDGHVERVRVKPNETLQDLIKQNGWKVMALPKE